MIESTIFEPKGNSGFPFLILILIVVILGIYGVIRSMKGGSGPITWVLGSIVIIAIVIGVVILQAHKKVEAISISKDSIGTSSWNISFNKIKNVIEDQVSSTQYVGGRPVISVQRRLLVDTDDGRKVIAYEATFDIDDIKSALDSALKHFQDVKR